MNYDAVPAGLMLNNDIKQDIENQFEEWIDEFDLFRMEQLVESMNFEKNTDTLIEWATKNRVFPPGTPFEGPYQPEKTPYMIDIMNDLSPSSPAEVIAVMKPVQAGATAGSAENLIGFKIDVDPGPMLYVTATDDLAQEWSGNRLEPMLELCGLMNKFRAAVQKKGGKATGNKVLSKTFTGGNLLITSYGCVGMLRSQSFQIVIFDEVDASPISVKNEGDPKKVGEARTTAYAGRKKILIISTPLEKQTSKIWQSYLEGDQRKFYVGCPHCYDGNPENMINISLVDEDLNFRLHYDFMEGSKTTVDPDSVYFPCPLCGAAIYNHHKTRIYQSGNYEWRPQNTTGKKNYKSYHWDAAYSPVGMDGFDVMAQQWVESEYDNEKRKTFINLRCGLPHEDITNRVSTEEVMEKAGGYEPGTIPDDVVFTTIGADLHGDRLDAELLGFNGNEILSLDWMHFWGKPTCNPGGSLWKFKNAIDSGEIPGNPKVVFIDKKYQPKEVYRLAAAMKGVYPVGGEDWIAKGTPFVETEYKEYNAIKSIRINTGYYKKSIMDQLQLKILEEGAIPPGYPRFPNYYGQITDESPRGDLTDEYFDQLNSEIRAPIKDNLSGKIIKYKWVEHHSRGNHALDCHVYGICAADFHIYDIAKMMNWTDTNYEETVWEMLLNPESMDLVLQALQ